MKVTFLGTGTSQGVPIIGCKCEVCVSNDTADKRLRTSVLIQHKNKNIVIDSGPDFRQQMLRCGIDRLDGLVLTHAHKDHIAGLDDIRAFNFIQKKAINVYCTKHVENQIRTEFAYIFSPIKYPGIPEINIINIANNSNFFVDEVEITPIEVMHLKLPVLGFRIDDFVYITDANFIADVELKKIVGCNTFVLNALRIQQHISHYTLSQAIDVVQLVKPKQALFTHISHQMGLHKQVSLNLPQGINLAYDGLTIQL